MNSAPRNPVVETLDDVCALPLVRRLAAMLDHDPFAWRNGDFLPHGWHVILFNVPTPQSMLRADGAAALAVSLPDIGLPRLMMGGRQCRFTGEIPIGACVRRESRPGEVQLKHGRSGRFALIKVEHRIFVEDQEEPAVVEHIDYVLREAVDAEAASPSAKAHAPATVVAPGRLAQADASRTLVPDAPLLFRYSSITDNPHRIHYDLAYATQAEGYPGLVVNGSIPSIFLLELFRSAARREPATFSSRNLAPMFCDRPLQLRALNDGNTWRLWAEDENGQTCFDASAT